MDELVRQISERTGIPTEQARQPVQMVLDYAKARLPAPLAAQLEGALNNESAVEGMTDQMRDQLGKLGGMFGRGS